MWDFPLFPEQASSLAGQVDALYLFLIAISLFFTALICLLILVFAIKYRSGSSADRSNPVNQDLRVELLWIFVPFAILVFTFVWSTKLYFDLYNAPDDAMDIAVVGRQWMWKLQHPDGRREVNELHVPLGQPVKLTMISQDVIHSFSVPAFRIKQDVLPGRYTSLWFQPTRLGRFHLFCTEYCGTEHSRMIGSVVVLEPSEYQEWLRAGTREPSMAQQGETLFRQYGCSGCHTAGSTVRAPLLEGLYGRPVPLEDGRVVIADDRYIRNSILLPQADIVAGYEPVMPTFEGQIDEDELLQIIAYIKSLGVEERAE